MLVVATILCVWALVQLALALRARAAVPRLDALRAPPLASWPTLSVIVPARDEAAGIEAALTSKLACGYPALEVVAIDDRSRDETGAILDRLAATDPRLRVSHVRALPEGWLGKLNAMAHGLASATGEWVLFSDADVHLAPGTLERLIAYAEQHAVDGVAVLPRFDPVGWVIDAASAGTIRVLALAGRTWAANDDRSAIGVGVGAFNLVRRRWLERTDAVSTLRMEIADDVALLALLKQHGARTRLFAGGAEVHLVFQDSIRAMAASADKAGGMMGFALGPALATGAAPLLLDVVLPLLTLASGGAAAALGALALVLVTATHVALAAHFGFPLRGALTWLLATPLLTALTVRAGLRAWRQQGVYWRSTFYPRATIEAGQVLDVRTLRIRHRGG